jgi:nucleotide-binding universal stress UspA family protein
MSYKTVLVHIDVGGQVREQIRIAAGLALLGGSDGHLVAAAVTGVSRLLYDRSPAADRDPNLALHLNVLRERARQALDGVEQQARALGIHSYQQSVADDEAGGGISLQALYADLVVIGQFDPKQSSTSVMSDFPAYVVMNSGRPVVIVPHANHGDNDSGAGDNSIGGAATGPQSGQYAPKNILISWNAGKEAGRAISAALPLLRQAANVHVAMFDPDPTKLAAGEQPGAQLLRYLGRHGVRASVTVSHTERHLGFKRPGDIGEALLGLAASLRCELLVMGAYGHSRFRETILGGVTRTVLETTTIPVLMAH